MYDEIHCSHLGIIRTRNSFGLATVRFWVADTMSCKFTPFILGGNQIKKIFSQIDPITIDHWPQLWRSMYHRYYYGDHWYDTNSNDLYDSETYDTEYEEEDSFQVLCRFESQMTPNETMCSVGSWLKQIEYPTPLEENSTVNHSVAKTGISGPVVEPDEDVNLTLAAKVKLSLPRIEEQFQSISGGESNVFRYLTQESEGLAAEAELPACKSRAPVVKLSQNTTVSCRITPVGETTFS